MPLIWTSLQEDLKLGVWSIEEGEEAFADFYQWVDANLHPTRKIQQLACRALLHELDPSFPFEQYGLGQNGKPLLLNGYCHFNLSHTTQYAAAIVSNSKAVGIDAERISDRVLRVQKKFLHNTELHFLSSLPPSLEVSYATMFWCIKEAVYKWWGKGGLDFADDIRIVPPANEHQSAIAVSLKTIPGMPLQLNCFQLEDHWIAYLAH